MTSEKQTPFEEKHGDSIRELPRIADATGATVSTDLREGREPTMTLAGTGIEPVAEHALKAAIAEGSPQRVRKIGDQIEYSGADLQGNEITVVQRPGDHSAEVRVRPPEE